MAQKYACLFYQSQAFKQNVTTKRSCHSKPDTTHVFERTIMWLQHFLTETANLWFYVLPCKYSDPPVFLPCCRTGGPVIKNVTTQFKKFIHEHANWMFFEIWKICLSTLPISHINLFSTLPILAYLECFHLLQIIITALPPHKIKNFVSIVNPPPYWTPILQLETGEYC